MIRKIVTVKQMEFSPAVVWFGLHLMPPWQQLICLLSLQRPLDGSILDAELKFPHLLGRIYQSAIEIAVERLHVCPPLS